MAKGKFYVVWKGLEPGVYESWNECKRQISNFEGALYKSFDSYQSAKEAYHTGPWNYIGKNAPKKNSLLQQTQGDFIRNSLAVDASCLGNPGIMEYRGVLVSTGAEIFHVGPYKDGTNNIGEFLAIVHGLALLKKNNTDMPIYSDSANAILWVRNKKCNTKLVRTEVNSILFDLIERAENWLKENSYQTKILKWDTGKWGEIPADFGRK